MPDVLTPAASQDSTSPLDCFTGCIAPTRTGPLYQSGLAIVALAMVLLPLIYIGLIVFTGWGVFLHLKTDTWILSGGSGRGGFMRLLLYLGPAVAGVILIFFMVKPFFAAKAKSPEPITLDPAKEPLLFAFVAKICSLVGAPAPSRIDVDCQVNASASLRRGLWSKDLVLTIGVPLASGLDMRQFAGVLAHEFGHFAQGAGMRLTYIIRRISFWFARVVYERDEWDIRLEQGARESDWRIGIVLHVARGCVWVSRRILWGLMHAGNAISCFMLRQMEYDADSYEAKIAGSDTFEQTASRLRLLNVASDIALQDVRTSWASNRLPENLPLLIDHKAGCMPAEILQKLSASTANEKTGWFDTHPCDADRTRHAQALNEPGVFLLTEPATRLFADFPELGRTVTRHQYEKHFELQFSEQNLVSAEDILKESAASAEADAMVRKYYGEVSIALLPLLSSAVESSIEGSEEALKRLSEARKLTESLRAEAEKWSAECVTQQRRLVELTSVNSLLEAGFKIQVGEFGLPVSATSVAEQEAAARVELEKTKAIISDRLSKLGLFIDALRERVLLALKVRLMDQEFRESERAREISELTAVLAAVGAEMPRLHQVGASLSGFTLLAQNCGNHSDPAEVDRVMSEIARKIAMTLAEIRKQLQPFVYPFPHARGRMTVAEYAHSEQPATSDFQRVYQDGHAHVERLFALNYRLIGRILALANEAEGTTNGE